MPAAAIAYASDISPHVPQRSDDVVAQRVGRAFVRERRFGELVREARFLAERVGVAFQHGAQRSRVDARSLGHRGHQLRARPAIAPANRYQLCDEVWFGWDVAPVVRDLVEVGDGH